MAINILLFIIIYYIHRVDRGAQTLLNCLNSVIFQIRKVAEQETLCLNISLFYGEKNYFYLDRLHLTRTCINVEKQQKLRMKEKF